jgi:hypothetical protein
MAILKKFKLLFFLLMAFGLIIASTLLACSQTGDQGWSIPQKIAESNWYWILPTPSPIAVDQNGNWHLVYSDEDSITDTTYIKYISETSPTPYVIASAAGRGVGAPSIEVDSNGGLHVTYMYTPNDDRPQSIMYTYKADASSSWSIPLEIAESNWFWILPTPSPIAVDQNGNWHLVYSDEDSITDTTYIKYISETSSTSYVIASAAGRGVGAPSIEVDSNGGLHVTYMYAPPDLLPQSIMYTYKE